MSVHGYKPYAPQRFTESVLIAARNVLVEYEAWDRALTVRQVFYRLVQEVGYDKSESAYDSLTGYISRARRAAMHARLNGGDENDEPWLIPFGWIRDDKGYTEEPVSYESADDFLAAMRRAAEQMNLNRQEGQPEVIELWCEAQGMAPLITELVAPFGIRVSSGGGYDSVTAKHDLAKRVARRAMEDRPTRVLHVGDFDPSGEGMYETLRDDVDAMLNDLGIPGWYTVERLALTEEQVVALSVETAPPKPKDSRTRAFIDKHPAIRSVLGTDDIAAQLEALTPPDLTTLIRTAVEERIDTDAYEEIQEREAKVRKDILGRLD
jgi:hypothetical protein